MTIQCYYQDPQGKRCPNNATEALECWCSKEHQHIWQSQHYQPKNPWEYKKRSLEEIQQRIKEIVYERREKRMETQQSLISSDPQTQ